MSVNPIAIAFIAFAAVIGAICGEVLVGLAIGLAVVLFASLLQ